MASFLEVIMGYIVIGGMALIFVVEVQEINRRSKNNEGNEDD